MMIQKLKEKVRRRQERSRKSIELAKNGRWAEALSVNLALLDEFPDDLETINRMGKALTELGRVAEASDAYRRALNISPHNAIARRNLDRLAKLGDERPRQQSVIRRANSAFVGDTGKTLKTTLLNVADPKTLAKATPGDDVELTFVGATLMAVESATGKALGQVEARAAARIKRLTDGGNRYQAIVQFADDRGVAIIIREVYRSPSQANVVSFPSSPPRGARAAPAVPAAEPMEDDGADISAAAEKVSKDWSNDDTEPGDDEAFTPVSYRIVDSSNWEEPAGEK